MGVEESCEKNRAETDADSWNRICKIKRGAIDRTPADCAGAVLKPPGPAEMPLSLSGLPYVSYGDPTVGCGSLKI